MDGPPWIVRTAGYCGTCPFVRGLVPDRVADRGLGGPTSVRIDPDGRMFDAQVLSTLRQGASFFASATMIAIGGGLALVGNAERLQGVASDLTMTSDPRFVWEFKLLVTLFLLSNAFLKFVWSHRLFGYCAILIAAVPNEADDPSAFPRASKAAEVNITAARSFNRGLRSVYFALASAAWLVGAWPLVLTTLVTLAVLWRREFASQSRAILTQQTDGLGYTQT